MSGVWRVKGEPGAWRMVGQATYVDDEGREVEHDWVLMREVAGDREVAVPPEDTAPIVVRVRTDERLTA